MNHPFPLTIDRESPIPIYHQISTGIINLIHSGVLAPNDRLPSENEFADWYSIVPMTVRQAMSELVKDGYIYRIRGRGTYVAPRFLEHTLERLVSFSEDMRSRNLNPSSKILDFEVISAPSNIARIFHLSEGSNVIRIKRLRLANNEPVGFHDAYIAGVKFTKEELEETGSLYELLTQKEVVLTEGDDVIEAVESNEEMSELLKVRPGAALLRMTRTSRDSSGRTIEYVEATYRADLYRYAVRLKR
jgi:GntR family transcriptional regulator